MYFGQKIHPLNFAYSDGAVTDGDSVVLRAADRPVAHVTCIELAPWAIRLRVANTAVTDVRQYSDGVAPAWRNVGRDVSPVLSDSGPVFETAGFTVTTTAAGLDLRWRGRRPSASGHGPRQA